MLVTEFDRPGPPDVLIARRVAVPVPGPDAVLVEVRATGVNFVDTLLRRGVLPCPLPGRLGREGAGVVRAVGGRAGRWAPGDRVAWTMIDAGSYAEQAIIPADRLVAVPDDIDDPTAAAILTSSITADVLADEVRDAAYGDTVLVHAAAGGVGAALTAALSARGFRVIGVVSGAEKAAVAESAGAHTVVVASGGAFRSRVGATVDALTGGAGVRAVYDSVGLDTWDTTIAAVGRRGTIISYGEASGAPPATDVAVLAARSLRLVRPTTTHFIEDPAELAMRAARAFDAVRDGSSAVPVTAHPLADAAAVHAALEGRTTVGKHILIP